MMHIVTPLVIMVDRRCSPGLAIDPADIRLPHARETVLLGEEVDALSVGGPARLIGPATFRGNGKPRSSRNRGRCRNSCNVNPGACSFRAYRERNSAPVRRKTGIR